MIQLIKRAKLRRKQKETRIINLSQGDDLLREIDLQRAVYNRQQQLKLRRAKNIINH